MLTIARQGRHDTHRTNNHEQHIETRAGARRRKWTARIPRKRLIGSHTKTPTHSRNILAAPPTVGHFIAARQTACVALGAGSREFVCAG